MHPYSRIDTTAAWKKLHFILSDRFDFHMINHLSIAVHEFISHLLMLFSVNQTLLPRLLNLSSNFREVPLNVEMPFFICFLYFSEESLHGVEANVLDSEIKVNEFELRFCFSVVHSISFRLFWYRLLKLS